jgi:hypothetical protein
MRTMERGGQQPTSTLSGGEDSVGAPEQISHKELRRARAFRRLFLLLLAVFLVLGALNFFGVRMGKTQAQKDPYQLEVSYPKTGRPGIGAPLEIQLQKQGGFDGPVTIVMSSDYLNILDVRSIAPEPSDSTSTDKSVVWSFDAPPGDTLTVSLNGEFEADEHPGHHHGTVSVVENGKTAVQAQFTTWEAP